MKANHCLNALASAAILWSLSLTGEGFAQERSVGPPRPATSAPLLTACSPDGEFFVVVTAEGRITYGRASDGATLRTFYQCHLQAVEFSPDGRLLAAIGARNGDPARIKVWNVDDGKLLCQWKTEGETQVRLYETSTGRELATLSPANLVPIRGGQALTFSPGGQWLLVARHEGEAVAWNIPSLRRELAKLGLDWSVRSSTNTPSVVSLTAGEPIVIKGRSAGLAFSRDGTLLTSGSSVWSSQDGTLLAGSGTKARNGRPAFSPDGKYVANGLEILEARNGNRVTLIEPGFDGKKTYGVAFSPDGTMIAVGKGDWSPGDLKLFPVPGGEAMRTFAGHTNPVWDVAFSPDGRFLASASGQWKNYATGGPGEARLWDLNRGESMQIHETPLCLYSVAFSGDGRRFAASGGAYHAGFKSPDRGEIRVWDAASGEEVFSEVGLSSCVYSVALSPDGKRLVAAVGPSGERGAFDVKLWEVETGREILTLGRHEKKVYGVAFSADGKRIASGSLDGVIQIWRLD